MLNNIRLTLLTITMLLGNMTPAMAQSGTGGGGSGSLSGGGAEVLMNDGSLRWM